MVHRSIMLGAILAAFSAGSANAETQWERVSHRDLDLTTAEGQAVFEQRLDSAAWRVCRLNADRRLASPMEKRACYRQARKGGDGQVAQLISQIQRGRR